MSPKMTPYLFISAGASLLISGITLLVRQKASATTPSSLSAKPYDRSAKPEGFHLSPGKDPANLGATLSSPEMPHAREGVPGARVAGPGELPQTALLFEQWVINHTHPRFWTMHDKRLEPGRDAATGEAGTAPRLLFSVKKDHTEEHVALACSWSSDFDPDQRLQWTTEEQMRHCRQYERDGRAHVFAVIGVGGSPADPADLFILPLNALASPFAGKDLLQTFLHRSKSGYFYYNFEKGRLRLMNG